MVGYIPRWYVRRETVTHPSTGRAQRRVTSLTRRTTLPLRQSANRRSPPTVVYRTALYRSFVEQPNSYVYNDTYKAAELTYRAYEIYVHSTLLLCRNPFSRARPSPAASNLSANTYVVVVVVVVVVQPPSNACCCCCC